MLQCIKFRPNRILPSRAILIIIIRPRLDRLEMSLKGFHSKRPRVKNRAFDEALFSHIYCHISQGMFSNFGGGRTPILRRSLSVHKIIRCLTNIAELTPKRPRIYTRYFCSNLAEEIKSDFG